MRYATAETAAALVRVTIRHGERRADLAVPTGLPVAELLPELAATVGALDAHTVHGGYRLTTQDGTAVRTDDTLTAQGVEDGDVLTVHAAAEDTPPRVYDDVVEAVADAIEAQTRPWGPEASRRTALTAAVLVSLLAAYTLHGLRSHGLLVTACAAAAAVLLLTAATVIARGQKDHAAGVLVAWLSVPYAALAGATPAAGHPWTGLPLALGGGAAVLAAVLGIVAVPQHRSALLPALVVGGVAATTGLVVHHSALTAGHVAATLLALVVTAGSVVPWLSLSTTRLRAPQPRTDAEILADPDPIDPAAVAADVRLGREVHIALTASVGATLLLAAPLVVPLGVPGALLVVISAVALILRTRHYRDSLEVGVAVATALAALTVTVVVAGHTHPDWRPVIAGILVLTGVPLVVAGVVPRGPDVRLGRFGDVLESLALVGLLPVLVGALGLLSRG